MTARIAPPEHDLESIPRTRMGCCFTCKAETEQDFVLLEGGENGSDWHCRICKQVDCVETTDRRAGCIGVGKPCPECGAELITKRAGDESWRVCGDAACGYEEN